MLLILIKTIGKNDLMGFADPVPESCISEHEDVDGQVAGIVS